MAAAAGFGATASATLLLQLAPGSPGGGAAAGAAAGPPPSSSAALAAPGRVEGAAEAVEVGGGTTGVLAAVLVAEGERVAAGQVLARIECADVVAEVPMRRAEAEAAAARSEVVRLGPRRQEVQAAAAEVRLAEARLAEASGSLRRSAALVGTHVASRARLAEAERDERIAAAQLEAVRQRLRLLEAGPRPEEVVEARARADAARLAAEMSAGRLARCEVRSPIPGMVLRKHVAAGELASVTAPRPLFTLADLSRVRVRAEVDERDLGGVALGQEAVVIPAYADAPRLRGRVVEIGARMGRRRVLTGDPAEKSDRDVLEVVVDLDEDASSARLPVGLRVSVLFSAAPNAATPTRRPS